MILHLLDLLGSEYPGAIYHVLNRGHQRENFLRMEPCIISSVIHSKTMRKYVQIANTLWRVELEHIRLTPQ